MSGPDKSKGFLKALSDKWKQYNHVAPTTIANWEKQANNESNKDLLKEAFYNSNQNVLENFKQSLEISRKSGDRVAEQTTLNDIGKVCQEWRQYALALTYFNQALLISREVRDRAGEETTLNNVARVYYLQKQDDQALQYYNQVLEINRETGDRTGEGTTLNNIGYIYKSHGQYDQALKSYSQVLEINRETGDREGENFTLYIIGTIYHRLGRYDQALKSYNQILEIYRETGKRERVKAMLYLIGTIYESLGQPDQASNYFKDALVRDPEIVNKQLDQSILKIIESIPKKSSIQLDEIETPNLEEIKQMLERLKALDQQFRVFGAQSHQYKSYPLLGDEIKRFEVELGVRLPDDYRQFLQEIGCGAGPYYGLFSPNESLGELMGDHGEQPTWPPKPGQPFPISPEYVEECYREKGEGRGVGFQAFWPANGCIPICHEGCIGWHYLVTAGDLLGSVLSRSAPLFDDYYPLQEDWYPPSQPPGIFLPQVAEPIWSAHSCLPTFLEWYSAWLRQCLSDFEDLDREGKKPYPKWKSRPGWVEKKNISGFEQ
jgi:tetratricopeptide (TPR) repeat protein